MERSRRESGAGWFLLEGNAVSGAQRNQLTQDQVLAMGAFVADNVDKRWTYPEWDAKVAEVVGKSVTRDAIRRALRVHGVEPVIMYGGNSSGRHHDRVREVAKNVRRLYWYLKQMAREVGYNEQPEVDMEMLDYVISGARDKHPSRSDD